MDRTGLSADALPAAGPIDVKQPDRPEETEIAIDVATLAARFTEAEPDDLDPVTLALQNNLHQRYHDQAVITALAEAGFSGPLYGRFEHTLSEYGLRVIASWIKSGKIWGHCRKAGFGLPVSELDRRNLESDQWQAAHDLASSTVAVTLRKFRQLALIEGKWNVTGGATITTFFMGLVAYTFPNEYRLWRASSINVPLSVTDELPDVEAHGVNPADLIGDHTRLLDSLRAFNTVTGQIICLTDMGFEQEEIAGCLGLNSARAVEGHLYRARKDPGTRGKVKHHA